MRCASSIGFPTARSASVAPNKFKRARDACVIGFTLVVVAGATLVRGQELESALEERAGSEAPSQRLDAAQLQLALAQPIARFDVQLVIGMLVDERTRRDQGIAIKIHAMVGIEHDNRVVGIWTFIQGIKYPTNLFIYPVNAR